jgi:signal transduction histidine kinase/DNA-binding response OmpR family regulator
MQKEPPITLTFVSDADRMPGPRPGIIFRWRSPAYLLLCLLLVMAPAIAVADPWPQIEKIMTSKPVLTDDDWRDIETLGNRHWPTVKQHTRPWLRDVETRGGKHELLKLLRLWVYIGFHDEGVSSPEEAKQFLPRLEKALGLATELGDLDAYGWLLVYKAIDYRETPEQPELLDQATVIAEQRKLDRLLSSVCVERAHLSHDRGRLGEMFEWLSKAYSLAEGRNDRRGMAHVLWTLTNYQSTYFNGDKEAAAKLIHYATQGLALVGSENDSSNKAFYDVIGRVYLGLKDYERARENFEKALTAALVDQPPDRYNRYRFLLAHSLNMDKRYPEALPHLEKLVSLVPTNDIAASDKLQVMAGLARALAHLGRMQESRNLLRQAHEAFALLVQRGQYVARYLYHLQTADAYAALGDYPQAYQEHRLLAEEEQRLRRPANAKQQYEYQVRFYGQLKDTENALLRSLQEAAESRRLALILALALSLLLLAAVWYYLRKRAATAHAEAAHHKALAAAEAQASQAKSAFVSNMSHELRSPLNVVLGFTQLLMRERDLPEGARHDLAAIYNSGHHLYTLINQVLDISKIEAGRMTLNESEFDLYALLDELVEMLDRGAQQKGLKLTVENAPDVPQQLRADALKLRQVLINLLNNALKFTEQGSVSLQVSVQRRQEGKCVLQFAVSDTGAGIAEDELHQLGQAFVQAQAGRLAREGTGLGLAISSGFVQLMGGALQISSQPGQGTTIAFALPVHVVERTAMAPAIDQGRRVVGLAPGQPCYRLLVVDDSEDNRQLLVRLLVSIGFEVRAADNGEQAVALWKAWQPHLIWMDIRMPVMSGREATRCIKAEPEGQNTIIIALTASTFAQEEEQMRADGCDGFVRKPFREQELFDLLQQHLGVQFVYDGAVPEATEAAPDAVRALPVQLRDELRSALTGLDAEQVEQLIAQAGEHDAALAEALAGMARRYDYQQMLDLIGSPLHA